ncbi:diacylglycerol/lipid kinase family protein [Nocardia sp. NPDC049149]|uniref:diacylglycerol/lipid kinase family protein n=1 Tax=Nocardia sp. NPDC049149 TaxID=3364315 RepID=UPI003715A4E1
MNSKAKGGSATRWPTVERELRERYPDLRCATPDSVSEAEKAIRAALDAGARTVVAAGGDGTVNLVLNALMDPSTDRPRRPDTALGAIGLGSSNDFHKPFAAERQVAGLPVRLDETRTSTVDVGKATMQLPDGSSQVRYFMLNASMGLVAEGNHAFNTAGGLVRRLKRLSVEAAILLTTVRTIAAFRPLDIEIHSADWTYPGPITNVGVLKTVHFAGGMRYDTGVERSDGQFDVNIWAPAGRAAIVALIAGLYRGRFSQSPLAVTRRGGAVGLRPRYASPLELDGEVTVVTSARLEVLPSVLRVCG